MKRTVALIGIPFIVLTYLSLILFQNACDYGMSNKPKKEIPFNHQSHMTKYGATCDTCHGYDANGRFKGIPTVAECLNCHDREAAVSSSDPSKPRGKAMFAAYKDTDIPWESKAKQPDLVYFSHKVVMDAKYDDGRLKSRCGSCHGDKGNTTRAVGLTDKMPMGQCMDCHTALRISNACAVCHD